MARQTQTRSRGRIAVTAFVAAAVAIVCLGSTSQAVPLGSGSLLPDVSAGLHLGGSAAPPAQLNATTHAQTGTNPGQGGTKLPGPITTTQAQTGSNPGQGGTKVPGPITTSHAQTGSNPGQGGTKVPGPIKVLPTAKLVNNQTYVNLAIATIHASQRAAWEQGVTVQALLEWQYPDWTTYDAPGPSSFQAGSGGASSNRHGRTDFPQDVVLQAMRSVVAQDSNGRLGAKVTGDENPAGGSSLDASSNLESVLLAAYASGQISGSANTLDTNAVFGKAAETQYTFMTQNVMRGAGGILSQRMDQLQYWADTFYMSQPALAAFGLYTRNADALEEAYTQVKLYLDKLLYPAESGSKTGLVGHIRNEDGSWADPAVWVTGQGWAALGMLRVVAALAQSGTLSDSTKSNIVDLLQWTSALLSSVHATFDSSASLWHNYVDDASTFHDISGSLALSAATYRLALLAPGLVNATSLSNAEAVYKRVIPHLNSFGQFGDGLQCVDALGFDKPGFTSVEALSFGILLEAARRDYGKAESGQKTALMRTIGGLLV
ncbi:unnamed protein product [Tilletia controversa]|uniref:Uncharacterized protein n=3 Tax=Tilletia TaxID=13289 RepID=A0A8X7N272_9BASI|nr:hypothetical protein CF335_g8807 [Tilletia laevis]KAE8194583.1 hypothetical protein CF328_g4696 [Tilletia controversa]KAE8242610.1 hypothetical protein A4X03_0g7999 [Tilletia caries]KAE8182043.1 hypothetical protein CF336_g8688 [Tilletia laevis]KAE8255850.1 hypothetical protein A4X06_0g212 [Tilletia controversa]